MKEHKLSSYLKNNNIHYFDIILFYKIVSRVYLIHDKNLKISLKKSINL